MHRVSRFFARGQNDGVRREGKYVTLTLNCGASRHHNPSPFGTSYHLPPLPRWEACHWILSHRAGYLSEGAFMGRLGANVSGLAYSYAEYAPYGFLRIQFPCHPASGGTMNPPAKGRSILRTFLQPFYAIFLHNLRRQPRPFHFYFFPNSFTRHSRNRSMPLDRRCPFRQKKVMV